MPIPRPRENESKEHFLTRCMSNDVMNSEFPERNQRFAVCNQSWDDKGKSKSESEMTDKSRPISSSNPPESKGTREVQTVPEPVVTEKAKKKLVSQEEGTTETTTRKSQPKSTTKQTPANSTPETGTGSDVAGSIK